MRVSTTPPVKRYELEADPDGQAAVVIRQATEGDNIRLREMYSTTERAIEEGQTRIWTKYQFNGLKARRFMCYLVLSEVDGIINSDTDAPLFKSSSGPDGKRVSYGMTEVEFNRAWDMLPSDVVEEIARYALEMNPHWSGE